MSSSGGDDTPINEVEILERSLGQRRGHIRGVGRTVKSVTPDFAQSMSYTPPNQDLHNELRQANARWQEQQEINLLNKYWSYHTFPVTHTGATILTPEQPYLPSNKYWSYHAYPVSRTGATMLTQYHVLELPCLPSITYWSDHAYPVSRTGATMLTP
ncbi:hypothetical protein E3N88_23193 [Mikania micrantha]|uniref:Uncharacterized protein n=1 Tax=Mikania micrantha TaxID=192012 RepID=A0A5N6NCM3_9ASTR|nr:hypothetical protein E3N88_23193 [Mikania micrantha]